MSEGYTDNVATWAYARISPKEGEYTHTYTPAADSKPIKVGKLAPDTMVRVQGGKVGNTWFPHVGKGKFMPAKVGTKIAIEVPPSKAGEVWGVYPTPAPKGWKIPTLEQQKADKSVTTRRVWIDTKEVEDLNIIPKENAKYHMWDSKGLVKKVGTVLPTKDEDKPPLSGTSTLLLVLAGIAAFTKAPLIVPAGLALAAVSSMASDKTPTV